MSMFTLRRSQKQSGFTLMELLIVIAVLGLLLGMLIPRLAGVTDDTVDTVCDTNNKGIRYYTQAFVNKNGTMPNNLTNLVDLSETTYYFASTTEGTPSTGTAVPTGLPSFEDVLQEDAEALAEEFYTRNVPGAWKLDIDEVKELKAMGITTVYNYVGENRAMEKVALALDSTVMMSGLNGSTSSAAFTFETGYALGNPEWIGRIMMAVNDKCELVTQGYIQASALCPGAVLNEDNFSIKEYILVLPRLQATVDGTGLPTALIDGAVFEFISSEAVSSDTLATDLTSYRVVDVTFEAQDTWNFDMSCPEGHKWPDNDEDAWIQVTTGTTDGSATTTLATTFGGGTTYTD